MLYFDFYGHGTIRLGKLKNVSLGMLFENVLGLEHIKNHLVATADSKRVAHAQLFVGPEGSGLLPMALAYAQYLLCGRAGGEIPRDPAACNAKVASLSHPDLHFAFPVATTPKITKNPVSDHFLAEWRQFVKQQPYGNLLDWYRLIGIEKKQGQIGVVEAQDIVKKLSLKSYEGGHKIMIIWMAELVHVSAANKLLKLIEEPPKNTVLLLLAEDEEQIIDTIRSRCQILHFPPLAESDIHGELMRRGAPAADARAIAQQANGNLNRALDLLHRDSEDLIFERWFVQWVRSAFKAKGNKGAIHELLLWSDEVSRAGREVQKQFLQHCLGSIRQAMLVNFGAGELVHAKSHVEGFDLRKFAPFVHENNVEEIIEELETAIFHVERNGNAKLIFTDLSIKFTRLLHLKAS